MSDTFVPAMTPMGGSIPEGWRFTPILPLVFGLEMSYMEQVANLVQKVNEVIESDNAQTNNILKLHNAFAELEEAALGKGEGWITGTMIGANAIGENHLASGIIKLMHMCANSVGNEQLIDRCVTADKLADNSVGQRSISNGAVGAAHIANNSILEGHLRNGCVTTDKLGDQCVEQWNIALGAVGPSQIAGRAIHETNLDDGCVTNRAISDGAVTPTKFNTDTLEKWNRLVTIMEELLTEHGVYGFHELRVHQGFEVSNKAHVTMNGSRIHDLGDPFDPQDAVNKRYVDSVLGNQTEQTPSTNSVGTVVSPYLGNVANVLGDSITALNTVHATKPYHAWLTELLGVSINNYGVNGSGFTVGDAFYERYHTMDNADLIIVLGGVNDAWHGGVLGNFGDTNENTVYGALETLCSGLRANYPTSTIVFVTPTEEGITQGNFNMYYCAKAIKEVCDKYAIPVFDARSYTGMYPKNHDANWNLYTTDGLHWNDTTHEIVGKGLANFLLNLRGCPSYQYVTLNANIPEEYNGLKVERFSEYDSGLTDATWVSGGAYHNGYRFWESDMYSHTCYIYLEPGRYRLTPDLLVGACLFDLSFAFTREVTIASHGESMDFSIVTPSYIIVNTTNGGTDTTLTKLD